MQITTDTPIESTDFLLGADEVETARFVRERVERCQTAGFEIVEVTPNAVSFRTTVGSALANGLTPEAVAGLLFARMSAERAHRYHRDPDEYFRDEAALYRALGARLPD